MNIEQYKTKTEDPKKKKNIENYLFKEQDGDYNHARSLMPVLVAWERRFPLSGEEEARRFYGGSDATLMARLDQLAGFVMVWRPDQHCHSGPNVLPPIQAEVGHDIPWFLRILLRWRVWRGIRNHSRSIAGHALVSAWGSLFCVSIRNSINFDEQSGREQFLS
jgi:hypothetical protein